jgi:hypothetical protein
MKKIVRGRVQVVFGKILALVSGIAFLFFLIKSFQSKVRVSFLSKKVTYSKPVKLMLLLLSDVISTVSFFYFLFFIKSYLIGRVALIWIANASFTGFLTIKTDADDDTDDIAGAMVVRFLCLCLCFFTYYHALTSG